MWNLERRFRSFSISLYEGFGFLIFIVKICFHKQTVPVVCTFLHFIHICYVNRNEQTSSFYFVSIRLVMVHVRFLKLLYALSATSDFPTYHMGVFKRSRSHVTDKKIDKRSTFHFCCSFGDQSFDCFLKDRS